MYMSYGYQVTSTSAKLTALKKHFYGHSEKNVDLSIV